MTRLSIALTGCVVLAGLFAGAGAALAQSSQQAPPPAPAKLSLSSNPALDGRGRKLPGLLVLNATLTTAQGKPINNKTIDFYQRVDLFGPRNAYVGSAPTDSTGVASLRYESAQSGVQDLMARFAGTPDFARQEATDQMTLTESGTPFAGQPLPLGAVARGLAISVGLLGLATWILLLGIFARTLLGIRRAGAMSPSRAAALSRDIPLAGVPAEVPVGGGLSDD